MDNAKRDLYALTIPTGIGAQIGGFAGDAGCVAREFSKYFDLIVNPNVVNGGILSAINNNMYYVEGWALDEYLCGNLDLIPARAANALYEDPALYGSQVRLQAGALSAPAAANKIGIIFDCAIPKNILNIHINTINACKMVMGLDIIGYELTDAPAGIEFEISEGISVGNVLNPKTLLEAGKKLIEQGAQAIAVVCYFPDAPDSDDTLYCEGKGPDPIGGVEAVISHYLTSELLVPVAHSPAFSSLEISEKIENPKVASELISSTYLPCVLMGLDAAPRLLPNIASIQGDGYSGSKTVKEHFDPSFCMQSNNKGRGAVSENGIPEPKMVLPLPKGLIVPATALGSKGVLGAIKNGVQILAVKNPTAVNVDAAALGLTNIIHFESYKDCLEYCISSL